MKKGFTAFEMIIVILVIAVMAVLAIPAYNQSQENIFDNQAKANLKLIVTAERGYYIDMESYYYPSGADLQEFILQLNNILKLNLPADNNRKWDYVTKVSGGTNCCAEATRTSGTVRSWYMLVGASDVSSCPCP